jgi:hypothetical protein
LTRRNSGASTAGAAWTGRAAAVCSVGFEARGAVLSSHASMLIFSC